MIEDSLNISWCLASGVKASDQGGRSSQDENKDGERWLGRERGKNGEKNVECQEWGGGKRNKKTN